MASGYGAGICDKGVGQRHGTMAWDLGTKALDKAWDKGMILGYVARA